MKKVAIYGAGRFGKYILNAIKDNDNFIPIVFIDNYTNSRTLTDKRIRIVSLKLFKSEWADESDLVIIAVENKEIMQEMVLSLLPWYDKDILIPDSNILRGELKVCGDDEMFMPYIRNYKVVKPVLSYIEHDLTHFCNLKCKNCGHRSDLVKDFDKSDKTVFEKSFTGLSKIFSNIKVIRLMGGEPFLLNDLDWYLKTVRSIFPNSEIYIVTNGMLIPNVAEKILTTIKQENVTIQISQYPPTREIIDRIIKKVYEYEITIQISPPVNKFMERKALTMQYDNRYETIYSNCVNADCHTLYEGKIYQCGTMRRMCNHIEKIGETDNELMKNAIDVIDYSNNGWDILLRIERANRLCGYCVELPKWVDWAKS